jgi:1,4-dihydroxy-2-naphthoate polyprenyltransferase
MVRALLWWRAARPFSFTVSVLPPILGGIIAKTENPGMEFSWFHFVLTLFGCVLSHAGANMLADYFDFKNRVDREGTYGSSGVLVGKLMEPRNILVGSVVTYLAAATMGLFLVFSIPGGQVLAWIILLGGILGLFYTAGPFPFKYHALGDVAVFIAFGPGMTLGAYFVQVQHLSWGPVLCSIPVGFLVDAVLHSNNLRDIHNDQAVHIRTFAILIGENNSKVLYYGLVAGSYVSAVILVALRSLPAISLITLLSLPLAVRLMKTVQQKGFIAEEQFAPIDAATAQLHSVFGGLLLVSLLVYSLVIKTFS